MIGIFDSGLGGLTVVRAVQKQLPDAKILYFGDTARVPYGNKSRETITEYALQDAQWLVNNGATTVIIGCHSASSVARQAVRDALEPKGIRVLDVMTAGLADVKVAPGKKIGIIGTRATVNSDAHEVFLKERQAGLVIKKKACPLLVPLVEEGMITATETRAILATYLESFEADLDTVVLCCTHYPLLKNLIASILSSRVNIIDPAQSLARAVARGLKNVEKGPLELVFSDSTPATSDMIKIIFGKNQPFRIDRTAPLA